MIQLVLSDMVRVQIKVILNVLSRWFIQLWSLNILITELFWCFMGQSAWKCCYYGNCVGSWCRNNGKYYKV